jgi:tyrosine-protein phosphatase non-receptor type 23
LHLTSRYYLCLLWGNNFGFGSARKDAFTSKPISQHSLAYEKASIIFNIAAVLSSIGAKTNRLTSGVSSSAPSEPHNGVGSSSLSAEVAASASAASASGTKLAYASLRQAAGMLSYVNDNFLHAPSSDMSKDVVKWLVDIQLAQATEVFWERTLEDKKGGSLVARIAAQVTIMYTALAEEVKEWVTRGIFERSWSLLVQVSAGKSPSIYLLDTD